MAFSPDRQRVAVGFYDKTTVVVLSAIDLRELYRPDVGGTSKILHSVAWSKDGGQLYAGGTLGDPIVVRRWDDDGRGRYRDIEVSKNTIMQLLPLNDGGMLFGTSDPSFGIIDAQGRVRTLQGPGQLDFAAQVLPLSLSRDGKTVEVRAINPSRTLRFNLSKRTVDVDPAADPSLAEPVMSTPGLSVSDWKHEYKPKVNGDQISLNDYELSRSFAIAPAR